VNPARQHHSLTSLSPAKFAARMSSKHC
jgi:hypothetical protein